VGVIGRISRHATAVCAQNYIKQVRSTRRTGTELYVNGGPRVPKGRHTTPLNLTDPNIVVGPWRNIAELGVDKKKRREGEDIFGSRSRKWRAGFLMPLNPTGNWPYEGMPKGMSFELSQCSGRWGGQPEMSLHVCDLCHVTPIAGALAEFKRRSRTHLGPPPKTIYYYGWTRPFARTATAACNGFSLWSPDKKDRDKCAKRKKEARSEKRT
jgi:hypothetical protein